MKDRNKEMELLVTVGCHPVRRNKLFLIPKDEILSCSLQLLEKNIRILGYDGFILHADGGIEPSLENSVDYSLKQPTEEVITSFFRKTTENITHFEIVIQ